MTAKRSSSFWHMPSTILGGLAVSWMVGSGMMEGMMKIDQEMLHLHLVYVLDALMDAEEIAMYLKQHSEEEK